MLVTAVAVAVGLAVGALLPPGGHRFARVSVRFPGVLAAGAVLLVAAPRIGGDGGLYTQLAGYGLALAGVAANMQLVGMGVLLIGLGANALVIALNAGMPVRADALVEVGAVRSGEVVTVSGHRHVERGGDKLRILDDRIPFPIGGQVVSFGDLIVGVGLADATVHLSRRRRLRSSSTVAAGVAEVHDAVVDLREPAREPAHLAGAR